METTPYPNGIEDMYTMVL